MQPKPFPIDLDAGIRRLALNNHAFSRQQLLELGLGAEAIKYRVQRGRLVARWRGVYVVSGAPATREQRWAAAVLACGGGAVLSHLSAAALWVLRPADSVVIDTSVAGRRLRSRNGIRAHRPLHLGPEDVTRHRGIPVTSVARTLIDLAAVLGTRSVERLLDEADFLKLLDLDQLQATLERNATRTGARRLSALLAHHQPGTTRTRSQLEEAFFVLCRQVGLPQPEVNAPLGPWTIDFLWREERLAVETDGGASHDRVRQREFDGTRNAWLIAHDYKPLRLTWAQVTRRPQEVLEALEAVLPADA